MAARYADPCGIETLFGTHVPHILEKIFLSLDYESFKSCTEVNSVWKEKLTSESLQKKGKSVFREEIMEDEKNLWIFSQNGDANKVRRLISSRLVDINSNNNDASVTPLHEAARYGHKDVVEILLGGGADPNKLSGYARMAPLHIAVLKGYIEVAQLLLKSCADPNLATNDRGGLTSLHYALHYAAIRAKVKSTNKKKRYTDLVQLLLDNGGDPRKVDNDGNNPLSLALKKGHLDIVKRMEKATAEFSA